MPKWDPLVLDAILSGGAKETLRTACPDEATARELRFALYNRRRKSKLGLNAIITLEQATVVVSPLKVPELVIGAEH